MDDKMKSSFKSGEFWVVVAVLAGLYYLQAKGHSPDEIKQYGEVVVANFKSVLTDWVPMLLALGFTGYRTGLKAWEMYLKMKATVVTPELVEEKPKIRVKPRRVPSVSKEKPQGLDNEASS